MLNVLALLDTIFVMEAKVPTTDLPWDIHVGAVQRIPLHCWHHSPSPPHACDVINYWVCCGHPDH